MVEVAKGRRISTTILKIVLRRIFVVFKAVWDSASGGFRIVSNTLIISIFDIMAPFLLSEKASSTAVV